MADPSSRASRRRTLVLRGAGVLVATALALGCWLVARPGAPSDPASAGGGPAGYQVVAVERGDLTVGASLPGTIGFGAPRPLPVRAEGTVTWLPRSGTVLTRGQVLLRVDDHPVVVLYGTTPAYRSLGATVPAVPAVPARPARPAPGRSPSPPPPPLTGPDVRQLEENLSALGYGGFTVDDRLTGPTIAAIEAWQRALGVPVTGQVALGDVVFVPGPVRVLTDPDALGQASPASAVQQTSTAKVVTVRAPAAALAWAEPGVRARVTLPDQRTVAARVVGIDRGAGEGDDARVRLRFVRPGRAPGAGEVTVGYVSAQRHDVLTVPVTALVALAEGGYGVELDDARSGPGTFVPVTPGLYADGRVEITGEVDAGTTVRVPR